MSVLWTAAALVAAFLLQWLLTLAAPAHAWMLDPFLLVIVYCGLSGGEVHGMLAGAVAGWAQDVQWSSGPVGLAGLSKCLVGFAVGAAGTRFQLASPSARALVLLCATAVDALLLMRLASLFQVPIHELSGPELLGRAALNAAGGLVAYELLERRLLHEVRR